MTLSHINALAVDLANTSALPAMLIPKFEQWPVWLQIAAPLVGWFATYPTSTEKTKWGRRVHSSFRIGSLAFPVIFLHLSRSLSVFLVGLLALESVLLFLSFRKRGV